jgi:hypothetical protein
MFLFGFNPNPNNVHQMDEFDLKSLVSCFISPSPFPFAFSTVPSSVSCLLEVKILNGHCSDCQYKQIEFLRICGQTMSTSQV